MRTVVGLVLGLVASACLATSQEYTLLEGATATVTLMVYEEGPGFSVAVGLGRDTTTMDSDEIATFMLMGIGAAQEFLAEERWCMNGYTLGEPRLFARGTTIEGRCK